LAQVLSFSFLGAHFWVVVSRVDAKIQRENGLVHMRNERVVLSPTSFAKPERDLVNEGENSVPP
jgi:hypothetical protein